MKFKFALLALVILAPSALQAAPTKAGCLTSIPQMLSLITDVKDCPLLTNEAGEAIGYGPKCVSKKVSAVRSKAAKLNASQVLSPSLSKIESCPNHRGTRALDHRCVEERVTASYQALANVKQQTFCTVNK